MDILEECWVEDGGPARPAHSPAPTGGKSKASFPECPGIHKQSDTNYLVISLSLYISAISSSSPRWYTCFMNHCTRTGAVKHYS